MSAAPMIRKVRQPVSPSELVDGQPAFERGDHVEIGAALNDVLRERGPIVFAESHAHQYVGEVGTWTPIDETHESRIVQSMAGRGVGAMANPLRIKSSDVTGAIRLAHDQIARPNFFSDAPAGLAFANGFVQVDADGIRLLAHSPDNKARHSFPFAYSSCGSPSKWTTFLDDLFRDDTDRPEKIACLQEFAGAAMLGIATRFQRSIISVGAGDNGKSKLADIVSAVMPAGSVEAIPPQEWANEYRRALLAGKRLNVVAELPEADIIASEAFKAIIAGDPILGRHIYQPPFSFRPIAGHLFAANKLPGTNDQTQGFWRRFVVIRFNRSFTNDPARDPRIAETILQTEKPAIVGWMIDGALRLMRRRDYTLPASHHDELQRWRHAADHVAQFISDKIADHEGGTTPALSLYNCYRNWADQNGHRALNNAKFGARMAELGRGSKRTSAGNVYPFVVQRSVAIVQGLPTQNYSGDPNGYA